MTGARADTTGDVEPAERVGRGLRLFVVGFLGVFVVCGLASIEVWPLTGWRLYHQLRTEERVDWQLRAVDAGGEESPIVLGELPLGYRNTTRFIGEFPSLTDDERDGVCAAWATPLLETGASVASVRVYRIRTAVVDGSVTDRRLEYECAALGQ